MEKYIAIDNIDAYYEQVVKRKMTTAAVGKLSIIIIGILIIMIIGIIMPIAVPDAGWLFPVALMLLAMGIFLVIWTIRRSRVEYEYTFVTGELRIARIKGNVSRRSITYFDVKNIDDFGRYINPSTGRRNVDLKKYPLILRAAEDEFAPNTYYLVIHDKIRKRPALLLLTPNEKTLSLIRPYLSVELKKKFFSMQQEDELIRKVMNTGKAASKTASKNEKAPDKAEATPDNTRSTAEETEPVTDTTPAPENAEACQSKSSSSDSSASAPQKDRNGTSSHRRRRRKPSNGQQKRQSPSVEKQTNRSAANEKITAPTSTQGSDNKSRQQKQAPKSQSNRNRNAAANRNTEHSKQPSKGQGQKAAGSHRSHYRKPADQPIGKE